MAYAYPTIKTGTSQDLLSIVTRAYEAHVERLQLALPVKPQSRRLWLEPPFVLLGRAAAAALELVPADAALRLLDKTYAGLAAPRRYVYDAAAPELSRARALVSRVEREAGRPAALVALISHPPVMGELAHLNFELVRQASLALRQLRGRPCRPRLVAAVDPFALDTVSLPEEGLYAGFMGNYHLGFDRLALARPRLSRLLLRRAAWDRMALRLLRLLAGGGEAGLVLAGGVPSTTRTLYAAREWTGRLRAQSPLRARPAEVLARLRRDPAFRRFEAQGPHGAALSRSAWRLAEAWTMAALAAVYGFSGQSCSDSGRVSAEAEGPLRSLAGAFGLDAARTGAALGELKDELARETPYRARFFRALAGRVLRRRPVVLLPVVHRLEPLGVAFGEAWAWTGRDGARLRAISAGPGAEEFSGSADEFARMFVSSTFQ